MWGMWKKRYDLLRPPPIIGILGPPGSGKSSQCLKLLEYFDFFYMSNDYLVFEEIASGSHRGRYFDSLLKQGSPIPIDKVICMYKAVIYRSAGATSGFIVEGFPDTDKNVTRFEKSVTPFDLLIYLDCKDDTLVERLQKRNKKMNVVVSDEEIRKSIQEFRDEAYDLFEARTPKAVLVNGDRDVEEVFLDVTAIIDCLFKKRALTDPPECTPLTVCPLDYDKKKVKPKPSDNDPCEPEKKNKICPGDIRKCPKECKKDPYEFICFGWKCKPLVFKK